MSAVSPKGFGIPPDLGTGAPREVPAQTIPVELRAFLSRPGPQSLLIRGPPGCGKTTLSLALLDAFPGTRVLVTNRVTDAELRVDFPWLALGGPDPIQIVDAERPEYGIEQAARAVHALASLVDRSGSEDVSSFLWLPQAIQEAYASLDPERPAMVVVDSWDALVEEFIAHVTDGRIGLPGREDVERLLLAYMRRSMVTLVLVLEREGQTQLDYLVTAVVATDKQTVAGRLERTLALPKLRGLRIATPSYPYSLEGARFQSIPPFRHSSLHGAHRRTSARAGELPPVDLNGRIWPGNEDFASEFGVFELGTTTVVETDPAVPFPVLSLLVESPIVQTLAAGGRVLIIPPPGIRPDDLYQPYRAIFPAATLAAQLRIFSVAGTEGVAVETQSSLLALPSGNGERGTDPIFYTAFEFIREKGSTAAPNLIVRTTSGQRALAQLLSLPLVPENFGKVASAYVANLASHQIVFGNTGDPLLEALNDLGSLRLQIQARQGRYFLNGVRPFTSSFALTEGDRISPYTLVRMV
jgi:KaiC/GvpD/RAD55 family RecA-like ATPase